jgi:hypothetical protein
MRDRALLIGFSMPVVALIAVLQWDRLLPDRRDLEVLRPLPLRRRTLVEAKAAAVIGFLGLFVWAVNLFTVVVFPMVSAPAGGSVLRYGIARVVSAAGGAFVAFTAIALSRAAAIRGVQAALFQLLIQAHVPSAPFCARDGGSRGGDGQADDRSSRGADARVRGELSTAGTRAQ